MGAYSCQLTPVGARRARTAEPREALPGKVDETRAALLLGLSTENLRWLSAQTGLGHPDDENGRAHLVFTYAELYRLCRFAAESGS